MALLSSTGRKVTDMRKAWIENDRIRDIAHSDPIEIYHPDVAVFYDTEVPDEAENGDSWVDGVLTKRPIPEPGPVVPPVRTWDIDSIRDKLTLAEKVVWDNDSKPEVITAKKEFETPLEHDAAKAVLDFLVSTGVISQDTEDAILA